MPSLLVILFVCYFYLGVESHKETDNGVKGKEIMQNAPKNRNGLKSQRGLKCFPGICGIFGKPPGSPINHERDEMLEEVPNESMGSSDIGALTKNGNSSNGKNKQIAESPVENGNMNPHYEDELGNSHSVPTSPRSREQLRLHILNDHLEPSFKRAIHILSELAKKLGNFESCDKTAVFIAMTQQLKACRRILGQILEKMGRKLTEQEQILFASLDNQLDLVGDYAQKMDRKNINEILILLDISKEFEQFMELTKTMPKD